MITRVKTDEEMIREAARALAVATDSELDQACVDMVEVLRYARSIQWWAQFEQEAV